VAARERVEDGGLAAPGETDDGDLHGVMLPVAEVVPAGRAHLHSAEPGSIAGGDGTGHRLPRAMPRNGIGVARRQICATRALVRRFVPRMHLTGR
jgi:hypothetical protein